MCQNPLLKEGNVRSRPVDPAPETNELETTVAIYWRCTVCTFENQQERLLCEQCNTPKQPEVNNTKTTAIICSRCTYSNSSTCDHCKMCQNPLHMTGKVRPLPADPCSETNTPAIKAVHAPSLHCSESMFAVALQSEDQFGMRVDSSSATQGNEAAPAPTLHSSGATMTAASRNDDAHGEVVVGTSVPQVSDGIQNECAICLEKVPGAVFDPCGHMVCVDCSSQFKECPICRTSIEKTIKVFR